MSGSIRLSEKYGLNPSLLQCYWCGEDDALALLGHLTMEQREALGSKDGEAPHRICLPAQFGPCPKCQELMKKGVILVSVKDGQEHDPGEKFPNPFRTGGWVVVKDEAITAMFSPEFAEWVLKSRFSFIEDSAWKALGLPKRGETVEQWNARREREEKKAIGQMIHEREALDGGRP